MPQEYDRNKGKGSYVESTFQGLDFILDQARLHGMKVILSFVDNWKYHNGVDQFVDWSKTAPKRSGPPPSDDNGDPQPRSVTLDIALDS